MPAFAPVVVNFAIGMTLQVVFIPITNDFITESDEVFEAFLTRAMDNTVIGSPSSTSIIIEDDDRMLL